MWPFSGRHSATVHFSRAMLSREPMYSIWEVPMLVMMPMCGRAIPHSGASSPGWFMPISQTAISSSGSAFRMLRGTPMWLFRLPSVATVRNFRERTAVVRSFVEVFPLDPVRPTTVSFRLERHQEASFCRAASVSSTRMTAQEGSMPGSTRLTTTAAAVREASGANRFPSNFSPPRAKKTACGARARLSVQTPPEATLSKGPLTSCPPMALQMPCAVREVMGVMDVYYACVNSSLMRMLRRTSLASLKSMRPVESSW